MVPFCIERGSGPPLILLHGNGEDSTYFQGQIEGLQDIRKIYALDTRGHGRSPRGEAPFTLDQFVLDLEAFMADRNIESADLLGFSDGANIALKFALKHPEKVRHLILNGGNLDPSGIRRSTQVPVELGYRLARGSRKEMLGLMVNEPHIEPDRLKDLSMPVLVIAGTRDVVTEAHTRLIADSIPDSELVFLKGNHYIAGNQPEAFNAAVRSFLEREPAAACIQ